MKTHVSTDVGIVAYAVLAMLAAMQGDHSSPIPSQRVFGRFDNGSAV